jgi:hypothetical protein
MVPILQNSTEKGSHKNDNRRLQATNMADDEKRKILIDQAETKLSQLFEKARTEIEEEETNKNEKKTDHPVHPSSRIGLVCDE